jgi:hypothetical protein
VAAPLLVKFRVHTRSHIRLTFVTVETPVEHTEAIGKQGGVLGYDKLTGHPIPVAVRETVVKAVLNTKHDDGDNINGIYGT